MSQTLHCYDITGAYRATVSSFQAAADVAGDGGEAHDDFGNAWTFRDGSAHTAASSRSGEGILTLIATVVRDAAEMAPDAAATAAIRRDMAMLAKRQFDAMRSRIAMLESITKANQESWLSLDR